MRGWRYLILFGLLALTVLLSWGFEGKVRMAGETSNIKTFSIVQALHKGNCPIKLSSAINPGEFALQGTIPAVYDLESKNESFYSEKIFIYEFPSIESRKTVLDQYSPWYSWIDLDEFNTFRTENQECFYSLFDVKNAMIAYVYLYDPGEFNKPQTELPETYFLPNLKKIQTIWLDDLNKAEYLLYEGESDNWLAKAEVKYYSYYWPDSKGRKHYENLFYQAVKIKYKGDMRHRDRIELEVICDKPGGRFGSSFVYRDNSPDDGYYNIYNNFSSGWFNFESNYVLNIEWDNMIESMELIRKES